MNGNDASAIATARVDTLLGVSVSQNRLRIANAIHVAMRQMLIDCPDGRERTLAMTKLDEALMWGLVSLNTPG